MNDFFARLTKQIQDVLPGETIPDSSQLAFVFSPEKVPVPQKILPVVEKAVETLYSLSHQKKYSTALGIPDGPAKATSSSILMAYDFHIDEVGRLSLIEINTNASGYFLSSLLYKTIGIEPLRANPLNVLWESFQAEWKAFSNSSKPSCLAIVDDQIEKQNMRLEFHLYKSWIQSMGWPCELVDLSQLQFADAKLLDTNKNKIDFVYNRWTDFLFTDSKSSALKETYETSAACISPHPREYLLLADKQRLIDLTNPEIRKQLDLSADQIAAIDAVLIPTYEVKKSDPDWLWSNRKKLFFKPKRSFGGKATYRGMSISKKVFEDVLKGDFLAQEYRPAPTYNGSWKYDLRFYVYRDQIQLAIARLYQGQVTNFSTSGGGFAAIQFT